MPSDTHNNLQIHHIVFTARERKSLYWGEMLLSPIHCCEVTRPPYLLTGELCTSPLHSNSLYVYTVCCRRGGQCFSVLRTRHIDVVGDSSGRSYVTEQGHNVPLLRTRDLQQWTNSTSTTTPPIATPPCSLGVGEFLFIYCGKPFMHLRVL